MQTRAILEAAAEAAKETGEAVAPEIMVPLVGMRSELDHVRATIDATAKSLAANGSAVNYSVGTMIELPRAALRAQEIAEGADFFSFGTNDLTQTTFGISRDDAAGFIGAYQEQRADRKGSVRDARHGRRRRAGARRARTKGARRSRISSSASAASTAATPPRSASATRSDSTTCRARPSACRSRASRRRKRRSRRHRLRRTESTHLSVVIAGLDPAIHVRGARDAQKRYGMDARIKSGHDDMTTGGRGPPRRPTQPWQGYLQAHFLQPHYCLINPRKK